MLRKFSVKRSYQVSTEGGKSIRMEKKCDNQSLSTSTPVEPEVLVEHREKKIKKTKGHLDLDEVTKEKEGKEGKRKKQEEECLSEHKATKKKKRKKEKELHFVEDAKNHVEDDKEEQGKGINKAEGVTMSKQERVAQKKEKVKSFRQQGKDNSSVVEDHENVDSKDNTPTLIDTAHQGKKKKKKRKKKIKEKEDNKDIGYKPEDENVQSNEEPAAVLTSRQVKKKKKKKKMKEKSDHEEIKGKKEKKKINCKDEDENIQSKMHAYAASLTAQQVLKKKKRKKKKRKIEEKEEGRDIDHIAEEEIVISEIDLSMDNEKAQHKKKKKEKKKEKIEEKEEGKGCIAEDELDSSKTDKSIDIDDTQHSKKKKRKEKKNKIMEEKEEGKDSDYIAKDRLNNSKIDLSMDIENTEHAKKKKKKEKEDANDENSNYSMENSTGNINADKLSEQDAKSKKKKKRMDEDELSREHLDFSVKRKKKKQSIIDEDQKTIKLDICRGTNKENDQHQQHLKSACSPEGESRKNIKKRTLDDVEIADGSYIESNKKRRTETFQEQSVYGNHVGRNINLYPDNEKTLNGIEKAFERWTPQQKVYHADQPFPPQSSLIQMSKDTKKEVEPDKDCPQRIKLSVFPHINRFVENRNKANTAYYNDIDHMLMLFPTLDSLLESENLTAEQKDNSDEIKNISPKDRHKCQSSNIQQDLIPKSISLEKPMTEIKKEESSAIPAIKKEERFAIPAIKKEESSTIPAIKKEEISAIPAVKKEESSAIPALKKEESSAIPAIKTEESSAIPAMSGDMWIGTPCYICKQPMEGCEEYKEHLGIKHNKVCHQCCYCGLNLSSADMVDIHINLSCKSKGKPKLETKFHCPKCPKKFSRKPAFKVHLEKEHLLNVDLEPILKARKFECSKCKETFFDNSLLKKHLPNCNGLPRRLQLENSTNKVDCHICGKSVSSFYLSEHIEIVHEKKTFDCVCGSKFLNFATMSRHWKVDCRLPEETRKRIRKQMYITKTFRV